MRQQVLNGAGWLVCLECGNRFQPSRKTQKWCSTACQTASMRWQRDQIQNGWLRARWFLR